MRSRLLNTFISTTCFIGFLFSNLTNCSRYEVPPLNKTPLNYNSYTHEYMLQNKTVSEIKTGSNGVKNVIVASWYDNSTFESGMDIFEISGQDSIEHYQLFSSPSAFSFDVAVDKDGQVYVSYILTSVSVMYTYIIGSSITPPQLSLNSGSSIQKLNIAANGKIMAVTLYPFYLNAYEYDPATNTWSGNLAASFTDIVNVYYDCGYTADSKIYVISRSSTDINYTVIDGSSITTFILPSLTYQINIIKVINVAGPLPVLLVSQDDSITYYLTILQPTSNNWITGPSRRYSNKAGFSLVNNENDHKFLFFKSDPGPTYFNDIDMVQYTADLSSEFFSQGLHLPYSFDTNAIAAIPLKTVYSNQEKENSFFVVTEVLNSTAPATAHVILNIFGLLKYNSN